MDIQKLFEIQAGLDYHITKEHPVQEDEDRLAKKILALQVELGELANEWRGFKFWSHNQQPRTKIEHLCVQCRGTGLYRHDEFSSAMPCDDCDGSGKIGETNPLLEEYVDCLHFILSIGLELKEIFGFEPIVNFKNLDHSNDITKQFNNVFSSVSSLYMSIDDEYYDNADRQGIYEELLEIFLTLGKMLGFTWEQIEQMYMEKNRINHERQEVGY